MSAHDTGKRSASGSRQIWAGRILSALIVLTFAGSAVMKFLGGETVSKMFEHLELPKDMIVPVGIVELTCAVIYAIPQTAVLGAILLAGFMGGAICIHWHVGDAFYLQIGLGVLAWLGVYLRDDRLRALIPLRKKPD